MATKSLESQVREALIQKRTDELAKYVSENPNYRATMLETAEALGNSMIESIVSNLKYVDEDERNKMLEGYRAELLSEFRKQMDDPQQLKQMMREQAKKEYMSCRQLKSKLGSYLKQLRADRDINIDENALQGLENCFEGSFQYQRDNDKIVRRLTKIAKQEGLDVVTQKETRYRVIRGLFPKPSDYRTFVLKGITDMRIFFQQTQNSLMDIGDIGRTAGTLVGEVEKAIEKALEKRKGAEGDYLEKTIKEIYG